MSSVKTQSSCIGDLFALSRKVQPDDSIKTQSSSISDPFALSRTEQQVDTSNNVNLTQLGIIVGATAILLWIFYLMIKKEFERQTDRIMPAPPRPAEVKPIIPEEKPQPETASESPVVQEIISEPDKKA